uniref:protein TOPAZ1 n=1 Tax=Epinephelus lanceolatus TaxID=310571 RepID=UPI0014474C06|nr:protein TOPAZ1 [Epinephelus lanceolatus]
MLPSSNRVKLNRAALRDIVGLKLGPRRRKLQSVKKTSASVSSGHEPDHDPVHRSKTDRVGPGNGTETTGNPADREPETGSDRTVRPAEGQPETGTGTERTKRRSGGCSVEMKQQEPITRGECTKNVDCRTGVRDRDIEEDPGPGYHPVGVEIHRDKRMKLVYSVKGGILPSAPDLESNSHKDPAKTDARDNELTYLRTSDGMHSCSQQAAEGSSSSGSAVTENCVHKEPCGEIDDPTKMDAAQTSSELSCQGSDEDVDEPESFTCQRVRAYFRKDFCSCARTYMSWPWSNTGWKRTADPIDPSAGDNSHSSLNQNQPCSSSSRASDTPSAAPTDASSGTAHQVSHQIEEKQEEGGENILAERNAKRCCDMSSYSLEFAPPLMEAAESLASHPSDAATLSSPCQRGGEAGTDTFSASSSPANGPETDSSTSTPPPSVLGLAEWDTATTLSLVSSPFTHGSLSCLSATPSSLLPSSASALSSSSSPRCVVKDIGQTLLHCDETQMTWSPSSASPHNSDSFDSCNSSLLLPQVVHENDEGRLSEIDPSEFRVPSLLSPVASPQRCSWTRCLPSDSSDEEEGEEDNDYTKHKTLPGCDTPLIVNADNVNSNDYLELGSEELEKDSTSFKTTLGKTQSSSSTDEDDGKEEESQDETDYENDVEVPCDPKIKATLTSGALKEPCSSPDSDEDDGGAFSDEGQPRSTGAEGSSPSETQGSKTDWSDADSAGDILDEFSAYKQDILLVDVIQDDPKLFENIPQQSLLKLGPTRATEKTRPIAEVKTLLPRKDGASPEFKQSLSTVKINFLCDCPDITEKSNSRPWRPQCSISPPKTESNTWAATETQTKYMGQSDVNNNPVDKVLESCSQPIPTVNSLHSHTPPLKSARHGSWITNPSSTTVLRHQKSNDYCRQYFSESMSCGFKMCRFQHVPLEGDEKLCVETVTRFTKNPVCLQKAGAMFTGYYQNNPPGVYFSMPVYLSLLGALLKAGMVSDVFSVLSVSLAHKVLPGHEFLLALFNTVREKGLMGFVPELMQLTFKMASAGLALSSDCLEYVKNTPEFQRTLHSNSVASVSPNHKLSSSEPFAEYLNFAHSIVEIELCTKQEDWRRMGQVFRSICKSNKHPNQVGRISGRIAIALLSESKDKLSLPFAAFAESVCQSEGEDSQMSFLGRIGVSLMLRYHKTHQWAKGRRVVQVLSCSKVNYSTLKGLFGNEDKASRCYLITVAAELFFLSGTVDGALNTLRENEWFLSSRWWPCKPADLESRTQLLIRLAEKASHRNKMEILRNLPGLKEPDDLVDVSRYVPLLNAHLQEFEDRQILNVASDTVDFMLSKKLAVEQKLLQMLLQKLGNHNIWLRAREIFKHSLSEGYYPGVSAPPGFMALIVPWQLGEVELALTYEMFITVNATDIIHRSDISTSTLSITLKRTQSCESEYLTASSRVLSAACITNPKLIVHYTAVDSAQDQVFTLDVSSARWWLRHNHLWANEVWAH